MRTRKGALPCRSGKAKYENGSVYDGDFENDQRSGWGMQCLPDESVYVGEWAADKMNGKSLALCPCQEHYSLGNLYYKSNPLHLKPECPVLAACLILVLDAS